MRTDEVQFVHFNDVYHVPSPSVLTRFLSLQRDFAASNPSAQTLTIFSGDAFSPSLEASVLKGEQALPLLDLIGIDIGCYGNHDFDFGDARLIELSKQLKFPWLLSNAYHLPVEGKKRTLGSAQEYTIRDLDNSLRIGFIGLAGTDWPSNCELLPPCDFEPPVDAARRLARHLRVNERCDLVIALTHMRVPEDMAVANATASGESRIDLLLGGHDHEVLRRFAGDSDLIAQNVELGRKISEVEVDGQVPTAEGDIRLVKSGTDWRALSLIRLIVKRDEQGKVVESTVNLCQYTDIEVAVPAPEPQSSVVEIVDQIHDRVGALVQKPLLRSVVPIDGRNSTIRSQETNMGNMLADAIRAFYDTDIGFFNSGAIRSDQVLKATAPDGEPLLVRDIINICPFGNGLLVKRLPGEVVKLALKNGVSDMHTDGRFLQISGLRVVADWKRPEGSRIVDVYVERPDGSSESLIHTRSYTVAMPTFIAQGYDGFTWFSQVETIVGEEAAMTDSGLLLAIFGHGEESSGGSESAHTVGVERARAQIVVGYNPSDLLPIVKPVVEDRIRFV
ncbi:bifunctional metallophosphatase/5'-nucleotidase [Aspergillus stella-maris]|uniref:bifunctional metallophosphatase/5'-nucleotidase n=1 Tax=Aspergillus stella-maris TaxID=1810926 RepID=UPI003CCD050C